MAEQTMVERLARAIREEIVRQYRDDERGKCPAGVPYYEEHIGPERLARAAIEAMRESTEAMREAGFQHTGDPCWPENVGSAWSAMIDAALKG